MQIVTGRRGEPHVTSRQMQAVYRSFLGDFALLDIGEKLRAEAYSNDIVRVYDGAVSVQGIYAVIAYNQYDEVYIEPVSVGKKRIDTIVLHYTKDNTLDVEDMQFDVVQGEEYTDNPVPPTIPEGGDAWEGTTDIQVPIYDVEVTNFGLTVTPYARMLNLIPTLESIAERIPETVVTGVKGDSEVLYRDGDVNITKANIGLGNVDNTADTDKPISTATQTALNLKADLTYVDAKISAAYHAGGSKTAAELTSALLIADNIGKVYNMSDSGVTTSDFVEGAGEPINEGDNVGICNVGTEESPVYKFDLLSGFVDLSAYATTSAVNTGLAGKVDKVTGKGLSTEDYTTTDKTKLAGISEGATQTIANPADTATETLSKLEVGGVVYDVPQGASGATELSELTDVNLTDVEDNDILQYDETANKWKNSNALQGVKTATGNPLTIEDAAPVNAVNLGMDLEPIQDLHGYDNPWVGGAGKNKLPLTVEGLKAANDAGSWEGNVYNANGVYFTILTDSDGNVTSIKADGTASESVTFNIFNENVPLNGRYTLWSNYFLANGQAAYTFVFSTHENVNIINTHEITDTFTDDVLTHMHIFIWSGTQVNNVTFQPMITFSSESSTFAPYTNICPISGRSEVAIKRVGENLVEDKLVGARIYSGGSIGSDSRFSMQLARVKSGVQYTVTTDEEYLVGGYFTSKPTVGSVTYDGTIIDTESKTFTATIDGWFAFRTSANYSTPQLELGNQATTYEPYAGKTYTIQLGDTIYGGELDVTKGQLVVDRKLDDLGNFSYGILNDVFYTGSASDKKSGTINVISSQYRTVDVSTEAEMPDGSIRGRFDSVIFIRDDRYTTVEDFKAAMSGVQVCYEIKEPFEIDLTPQQIKMLENTNTLSSDGIMTLEYQPNNAIGEAVRVVEESYDPEFAVRPVLKKKAFSGTTDTDGSVTLINASDIPSGHKIIPLQITDMTINGSAGTYFVEYEPYNSGDSVKGYCYAYFNGSQITPVGSAVTGNFYYYELEV